MKNNGLKKISSFFSPHMLNMLSDVSDRIVKFDLAMRKFGLGNRNHGNSTVFTGNLINKHPLFLEVLEKVCPLVEERLGSRFQVSEFKLVSTLKAKDFRMWWHRDFPYEDDIDERIDKQISLAIIIPLCDFSDASGSTYVLPESHLIKRFPDEYKKPDHIGDGVQLSSKIGDIWIYDPRTIHSGAPNKLEKLRHIMLLQFIIPVLSCREDFKYQVERFPFRSSFLASNKHIWNTHKPDTNAFGSNRGWEDTAFKVFFSFFRRVSIFIDQVGNRIKYESLMFGLKK